MSEPRYSTGAPSGSSSHKRTFDAINPDAETDRPDPQHAGRRDSPVPSSSRAEASRERNKRARNDSDSSYTSELDDILLSAADSASSSSSGSSNSSYHSAQSTLPTAASPTLLDESEEDMHMLLDTVVSESHTRPASPIDERPTYFELFPHPRQSQPAAPQPGPYEDMARSLERASAFDREIAPLRSSPAVLPTSSAQGAGPLPPVRLPPGLDDFFPDPYSSRDDPLSSRAEGFGMFDGSWLPFERDNDGPALRHRRAETTSSALDANSSGPSGSRRPGDAETTTRPRSPPSRFLDLDGTPLTNDPWWRRSSETSRARRLFSGYPIAFPSPDPDVPGNERLGRWPRAAESGNRPENPRREDRFSEEPYFSPYGFHMNLLDVVNMPTNRDRDAATQPSTRSPRVSPSFTPRRFSDGLEARTMGSPSSVARTTPQPMQPRPSPRMSVRIPRDVRSALDDFDSTMELRTDYVDRTLREVDAHRRRIAEVLAEPLPPFPPYPAPSTAAASPLPTSSYSTLRHALDDNVAAAAAAATIRRAPPPAQEPAHVRDSLTRERITRRLDDAALLDDYYADFSEWDMTGPIPPSTYSLNSRRRGPYRMRTVDEMRSMGSNLAQPPRPTRASPPPAVDVDETLLDYIPSYLEFNSRARAQDLSGLRHRARPRSPSPVQTPPPRVPESRLSTWTPLTGMIEEHNQDWLWHHDSSNPSLGHYYPSRTPEDDAMLQSFTERATQPSRRADLEPNTITNSAARPAEDNSRQPRSVNIDLDAFRDGPFRATLARSVALQHRSTADRPEPSVTRAERREAPEAPATPASPNPWVRRNARGEDEIATAVSYRTRHMHTEASPDSSDPWTYEAIHRRMRQRQERAETRTEVGSTRARSPLGNETLRARPPTEPASLDYRQAMATPMYAARHRPSTVQEEVQRRLRQRTLLDREHASSHAYTPSEDASSRTSARMERVHRQRELVQRMMARDRRSSEAAGSASASASSARSETEPARAGGPPSTSNLPDVPSPTWTRRYARLGGVAAFRDGRPAEDRPAPLNGRFARRGTFGPHFPPDMVWVDVPPGRHSAFMRRRNFGDYVRDEDFDVSYEGLLSLSSLLGDAKPRGTPDDIIESLPRGTYREWTRPGATEERCPICLDDYQADDPCLRVCGCSHWFHEGCLQQWLKTARTCPVCRGRVTRPRTEEPPAPVAGPSGANDRDRDDDSDADERAEERRIAARQWNMFHPPWRHG